MAVLGGIDVSASYAFLASRIVSSNNGDAGNSIADRPQDRASMFLSDGPLSVQAVTMRLGANYVGPRRFSNARVPIGPGLLASDVRLPYSAIAQVGARYVTGRVSIDGGITKPVDHLYSDSGDPPQLVCPGDGPGQSPKMAPGSVPVGGVGFEGGAAGRTRAFDSAL